jgi:hypothetical protein
VVFIKNFIDIYRKYPFMLLSRTVVCGILTAKLKWTFRLYVFFIADVCYDLTAVAYLVHVRTLMTVFDIKIRLMHCICKHHFIYAVPTPHVSALKGPSSRSSDTFYEQS